MSNFPNFRGYGGIEISEKHIKAQLKNDFQAGYSHTRKKHIRARKKFTLKFNDIDESELFNSGGYLDHFDNNQGGSFNFYHPNRQVSYTVTYSDDGIEYDQVRGIIPYLYNVTINLEEI